MSAERPAAPRIDRGQVWRERATGWLVAIAAVNAGVVSLLDPERGQEAAIPEQSFRARFEYTGGSLCASPIPTLPQAPSTQPPHAASSAARHAGCAKTRRSRRPGCWPGSGAPRRRRPAKTWCGTSRGRHVTWLRDRGLIGAEDLRQLRASGYA